VLQEFLANEFDLLHGVYLRSKNGLSGRKSARRLGGDHELAASF
jgi:hypothetical protein